VTYRGKRILVCGIAKSGIAAARLLKSKGAIVTMQDMKPQITDAKKLLDEGFELYLGKNPDDIVCEQELVVLSPGIPCDLAYIEKARACSIPVISEVELAFRHTPCPVTAITGTNGKTTTTTLLGEIMKRAYAKVAVVGNIGISYSAEVEHLTKDDWVVAEISSFQMESADSFAPHISAVLNISPDHLNRHKTMEAYVAMKERVLLKQKEQDFCVLNMEDCVCRRMAEKTKAKIFFFSSKHVLEEGIYLEGGVIYVRWADIDEKLISVDELQILGIHNYENVMAAAAMAICAGVSMDIIRSVLRCFCGVAHRIEFVGTLNGVDYYNDSKGTNTDASIQAVLAMRKPVVLIGGGCDKGGSFDDWTQLFPGRVKHLVLIGETADKIEESAKKYGFGEISRCLTFEKAIETCQNIAAEGDCVLLSPACASWGMFENYEQRGDLFKKQVRDNLR